jgi:phospholipid-binding lipoprotein MlaA
VPDLFRTMVFNVYANLLDPWTAVNQLLQGKPEEAFFDLFRFAVNSTLGFAGIADIATPAGIEKHREDFGQTLGRWGVPPGPYLVLPLLGPSGVRDGLGTGVGITVDPLGFFAGDGFRWGWFTLVFVDLRSRLFETDRLIESVAIDRYSFVRDAYLQRRRSLVYDGNPPPILERPDLDSPDPGVAPPGAPEGGGAAGATSGDGVTSGDGRPAGRPER